MFFLNPGSVQFAGESWGDVSSVTVDRQATRVVEAWSDGGPHATLIDAPEQRTTIKLVQSLAGDAVGTPTLATQGELRFETAPTASDAQAKRVRTQAVVVEVSHSVARNGVATRTVKLLAVSSDGASDPLAVESV
ncbi:MAG: hypothetical protein AAF747_00670 [Planctomycetota bacterium]